jgi:hypothetical protein
MKIPHRIRLFFLLLLVAGRLVAADSAAPAAPGTVEQWDVFEIALTGPTDGNPFVDVRFTAAFTDGSRTIEVNGFYDGDGIYRVRFMPDHPGEWRYETHSNRWPLTGRQGSFRVTSPSPGNHGPVGVRNTYHFAYADGTPFNQIGTTSYTWIHRPEALQEQTLKTLAASPFNKLRMCVFPQAHGSKRMPPTRWPFVGTPQHWDFTRFEPEFFRHLEKRIGELRELGIECDLILFHPYDDDEDWGFETMPPEIDDFYLRYVVARLAAYRNLWWSMANEYDFLKTKTDADWDRFFQIVAREDPYHHLRSIHNGYRLYDYNKPWVTHASIQNGAAVSDAGRAELYREAFHKPVIYDEVKYEGDSSARWGDLSAQEMVHRFWAGTVAGTYVGHSEFFSGRDAVVWLGQGGVLEGESPPRLAFLKKIMDEGPADGIEPIDQWSDPYARRKTPVGDGLGEPHIGGQAGEYYLVYFGRSAPKSWDVEFYKKNLADGMRFKADVIDPWVMTITPVDGEFSLKRKDDYTFADAAGRSIALPGKRYMALRFRRVP